MANRPMTIKAVPGMGAFFRVTHKGRFICLIHKACDFSLEGMGENNQWNGKYVWVHSDLAGWPVPNRIPFNSFMEAYTWACDSEGIAPLF